MSKKSRNIAKLDAVFHVKPDTRTVAEKIAEMKAKQTAAQTIGKNKSRK
jgi:hypothetical protein